MLDRTVEALGRGIVKGVFEPGTLLPFEDELASRFNVGRNLVREAVKILSDKDLLQTARGRGTTVLPASAWNHLDQEVIGWTLDEAGLRDRIVDELTALRTIVEPEIAALAARHASAEQTLQLLGAVDRMERSSNKSDSIEADIGFHTRLFEATGNRLLLSLVRTVATVMRANFALAIKVERDTPQYLAEHRALAEAVYRRDGLLARSVMASLLASNAEHLAEMRAVENEPQGSGNQTDGGEALSQMGWTAPSGIDVPNCGS